MQKKLIVFLAMATAAFAGTKTYDVTFGAPAVLGGAEVPSGQYKLSINGSMVTLKNANNGKSVETPGTVQTSEKKYSETIVQSKRIDGKDLVDEIQLGGTKTAIDFKH
jgi:hypothetical protein